MPLTRLNDSAFDAQLEGVYFGMWNGSTSVRCFVSHEALTDKAQGSGLAENLAATGSTSLRSADSPRQAVPLAGDER